MVLLAVSLDPSTKMARHVFKKRKGDLRFVTTNAGTSGFKAGTWYVLTTRSCRSWAGRVRVIAMPEDEESWEVDTLMECITEVSWIWTFWWSFFKCCSLLSCIFWSCYCFFKLFIGEHPFWDNKITKWFPTTSWKLESCDMCSWGSTSWIPRDKVETLAFACFSNFLCDGLAADDWMDLAEKANQANIGPLNVDQSVKD